MPLDWWSNTLFWNRPDESFQKWISWPWCRAILNQVMDAKSKEISLSELDAILDVIDSREWVRWRVNHFLARNIPYKSSFSYIWCWLWGILFQDDSTWKFFTIECIDNKVFKTTLPNAWQGTWSDLWDKNNFEYIDLGFMFNIQTWCDTEQRRRVFFDQAGKWFAGRKSRKVSLRSTDWYNVYEVTPNIVRELDLAEILDKGFNTINY